MKKILIFIVLISITLPSFSQTDLEDPLKGITFESVESYLYSNGNDYSEPIRVYDGGLLIEIQGNKIITSATHQFAKYKFTGDWNHKFLAGEKGAGLETTRVSCEDPGGFTCTINLGYYEDVDLYMLSVVYDSEDILWMHWLKPTKKEIYLGPEAVEPFNVPKNINYTAEEIQEFWKNFGVLSMDFYSLNWL